MAATTAATQRLKDLLGHTWRISIQDNRVFIGTLMCTDKDKNIILVNTEEYRRGEDGYGRYVGMIMIPWRWITKAEVEFAAFLETDQSIGEGEFYT